MKASPNLLDHRTISASIHCETINQSLLLIAATELTEWRCEDMPEANSQAAPVALQELTESAVAEGTVIDGEFTCKRRAQ